MNSNGLREDGTGACPECELGREVRVDSKEGQLQKAILVSEF